MMHGRVGLPTYALYGEYGTSFEQDWLHCESIAARSRPLGGEIAPHRHDRLCQFVHVQRGQARVTIDGRETTLQGPALVVVPPPVVHGFAFEPEVDGTVVTVFEPHLRLLLAREPALLERLARPSLVTLSPGAADAALARTAAALHEEFAAHRAWRGAAIDAALFGLVVAAARVLPAQDGVTTAERRAPQHVRRFQALVEAQFREQPRIDRLAFQVGVTPTQLNRVCREVLGKSALQVLHGRLLLEAQRELAYTALSIKQIALGLGFSDAAYFSRFFEREMGMAPSRWRVLPR